MQSLNCRHPECQEIGTHLLKYFDDGLGYSIMHCKEHLDWAKTMMCEFIEHNKNLEAQESPVGFDV